MSMRKSFLSASFLVSALLAAPAALAATPVGGTANVDPAWDEVGVNNTQTATPIKHLVIIYDENVSFDHYFGSYPSAANPTGEPAFAAAPGTPTVNNLVTANLLTNNPNDTAAGNGANAANPFRLDRTQAATADQNHAYTAEQEAYDNGKADLFPEFTGNGSSGGVGAFYTKGQVMGYFDGNTVTALWNYAQHYAMSDNAFTDTYGPSTPGALEAVAGQTNGLVLGASSATSYYVNNSDGTKTLINDVDPTGDVCSSATNHASITARNIGDLLNIAHVPWGGFMGGFNLGVTNHNGTTGCARSTVSPTIGSTVADYVPHHNWFQYFASTANPTHARPADLQAVGYTFDRGGKVDPANHEYDLRDFLAAADTGYLPAVSYVKLSAYQDGHAGYSDPLDEQGGLIQVINTVERMADWKNTAIIVTYDDSDGWYDHDYATPTNSSFDATADQLNGAGKCGSGTVRTGITGKPVNGRCGPGTRVPFLVISPWAKPNYVDSTRITQASIVQFIEANWLKGRVLGGGAFDNGAGSIMSMFDFTGAGNTPRLFLNAATGESLN
jgi:phospholipase C